MRERRSFFLVAPAALVLSSLAWGCDRGPGGSGGTVVVVSIAGLRHDYPDLGRTPAFSRLETDGGRAGESLPVFPTNTVPNLAAISTGSLPGKNGVINNRFFDRRMKRLFRGGRAEFGQMQLVEPIWVTAVRQGVPAAGVNWIGSDLPFRGVSASRFSALDGDSSDEERVREAARWIAETEDDAPRLILVNLSELDYAAHEYGPDGEGTLLALSRVDAQVKMLRDALERFRGTEKATLLVIGSHGMAQTTGCVYLDALLSEKGIAAKTYSTGGMANVYLAAGRDRVRARAALLGEAGLFATYFPSELPKAYGYRHPDRVGDLVLIGEHGAYFRDQGGDGGPVGPPLAAGMHGFRPDEPDMLGSFLAWGRGVPAGRRWERVRAIDVYPTVCRLLGILPAAGIDGVSIPGIEAAPATRASGWTASDSRSAGNAA